MSTRATTPSIWRRWLPSSWISTTTNNTQKTGSDVWQAVGWLRTHKPLMSLGCVLVEYAMKTALAHLPEKDEERYAKLLDAVGVDLDGVGLLTIGQCAFRAATAPRTSGGFHAAATTTNNAHQRTLRRIMNEILLVASLPETLLLGQHTYFVWLLQQQPQPSQMEAAAAAYGLPAAVWVMHGLAPTARPTDEHEVAKAYAEWRAFCAHRAAPVIRSHGALALTTPIKESWWL
jgi:hypothetical protein